MTTSQHTSAKSVAHAELNSGSTQLPVRLPCGVLPYLMMFIPNFMRRPIRTVNMYLNVIDNTLYITICHIIPVVYAALKKKPPCGASTQANEVAYFLLCQKSFSQFSESRYLDSRLLSVLRQWQLFAAPGAFTSTLSRQGCALKVTEFNQLVCCNSPC